MHDILDYSADLRSLATLAADPDSLDAMLSRALDALAGLIPYDLAAVLELRGPVLRVRAARGALATAALRHHSLELARFPTIRRALETRRPLAVLEHDHAGDEGDPYDGVLDLPHGHSCMVVPLFAGERTLGLITLDRKVCEPYAPGVVALAGVVGQMVGLALLYAEQAALLDRYRNRLREQNRLLIEEAGGGSEATRRVSESASPAMITLARQARLVAETDTPVLISGETGVGKEVLAAAIHAWSPRAAEPFVKLNCAAMPEALVESELFGHTRGAFSGAVAARAGRFLTANGGTLLLDEVGDLPLGAQAKLLRVLQEGTFEAVGSDRTTKVDVRVIAASHVDLGESVAAGRFREDLYYRLAIFPLTVPPLRERRPDLLPLACSVLEQIAARTGRGPWTLPDETARLLLALDWPGNVRQLVNALERATILRPTGALGPELFRLAGPAVSAHAASAAAAPFAAPQTLAEIEKQAIEAALLRCGGRVYGRDGAAEQLGLPPTTLQSRMNKLGVVRPRAVLP